MNYSSPRALEMAIKEAARRSTQDTNRAISSFYLHRLLCRVFSKNPCPFVLKGGQGVLARIADARTTRDVDLTTSELSLGQALDELRALAEVDLGDFISFVLVGTRPIKEEDEYRDGCTVQFDAFLGSKRIQTVSVDLVSDEIPCEHVETLSPVDRIEIDGLESFDYRIYPVERSIADKVCAIAERHRGKPSSRVKDLVDIAVLACNVAFDGNALSSAIMRELGVRHLVKTVESFELPAEWGKEQERQYAKIAAGIPLPEQVKTMRGGESLAAKLINPCLGGVVADAVWNPGGLEWRRS